MELNGKVISVKDKVLIREGVHIISWTTDKGYTGQLICSPNKDGTWRIDSEYLDLESIAEILYVWSKSNMKEK